MSPSLSYSIFLSISMDSLSRPQLIMEWPSRREIVDNNINNPDNRNVTKSAMAPRKDNLKLPLDVPASKQTISTAFCDNCQLKLSQRLLVIQGILQGVYKGNLDLLGLSITRILRLTREMNLRGSN